MKDCSQLLNMHPNSIRRLCEGENPKLVCLRLPSGARRFTIESVQKFLGINTDTVIRDGELKQEKSFRVPIAGICRVSSAKQNLAQGTSDKSSLEHQEERVAAFIKAKWGNRADVTWYKSVGGGMDFNRPALIRLITDIVEGKFRNGWIIAQDFSRICRFGVLLIEHLAKLGGCKIQYVMDETEAESKGYAEQLTDEILSILTHYTAKASGEKARKILTVRVSPETVQEIYRMGKAGYSFRFIASELQRQGRGTGQCGRQITKRVVERVLKEHSEGLNLLEASSPNPIFSATGTQNSFVEYFTANVRLTGEEQCRVRQSLLLEKYREWARAKGLTPMTANSVRKTLRKHFPQLSTKFTDNACIQYTGMTFVNG